MKLYLDDVRSGPLNDFLYNGITDDWKDWIICRSVASAKSIVINGEIEFMSLDHDMGTDAEGNYLPTGYDFLCWYEELVEEGVLSWPKDGIVIHSSNAVGRIKMEAVIKRAYNK